jgi:hypothetical protein
LLTRRHLWQLAGSGAVVVGSVALVALGAPIWGGLVVLAAAPWVTVVGQEIDARRRELAAASTTS